MTERWKPIKGYVGLYEVSDFGRVRSLDRIVGARAGGKAKRPGRILKPSCWGRYLGVMLCRNKVKSQLLLHRLVLQAFKPRRRGRNVCNHVNRNTFDNKAVNLEWTTQGENVRHSRRLVYWTAKTKGVLK